MPDYAIELRNVAKRFGRSLIFRDVSFSVKTGDCFFITGPNGSGKSTLLQIIAGLQRASSGEMSVKLNGRDISDCLWAHLGFASPAMNLYEMLSVYENALFAFRGNDRANLDYYISVFGLKRHKDKEARILSSGLRQRLRLVTAMANSAGIILLDEPGSNLDSEGKEMLYNEIEKIKSTSLIIIASNEAQELKLCQRGIDLAKQSN